MAGDKGGGRSRFWSRVFWLFVYVAAYVVLRWSGEIVTQQIALPAPNGAVEVYRIIGSHPDIPHWRNQAWRALFSFAMVAEEEGRKIMDDNGSGGPNRGQNQQGQMQGQRQPEGPGLMDRAQLMWEQAKQYLRQLLR